MQRGALWWASLHRHHHQVSDAPPDPHSPTQHGFLWSHIGWVFSRANFYPRLERIKDFATYPELRFLDRFDTLVPILLGASLLAAGAWLHNVAPGLGVTGPQFLVWGLISTVVLFHGTSTINSISHLVGRRRYATEDHSRNFWPLIFITLGEGWHNNHHHFPAASRLGHRWWEIDPAFYLLKILSWLGLVWDLRPVPRAVLATATSRTMAGHLGPAKEAGTR